MANASACWPTNGRARAGIIHQLPSTECVTQPGRGHRELHGCASGVGRLGVGQAVPSRDQAGIDVALHHQAAEHEHPGSEQEDRGDGRRRLVQPPALGRGGPPVSRPAAGTPARRQRRRRSHRGSPTPTSGRTAGSRRSAWPANPPMSAPMTRDRRGSTAPTAAATRATIATQAHTPPAKIAASPAATIHAERWAREADQASAAAAAAASTGSAARRPLRMGVAERAADGRQRHRHGHDRPDQRGGMGRQQQVPPPGWWSGVRTRLLQRPFHTRPDVSRRRRMREQRNLPSGPGRGRRAAPRGIAQPDRTFGVRCRRETGRHYTSARQQVRSTDTMPSQLKGRNAWLISTTACRVDRASESQQTDESAPRTPWRAPADRRGCGPWSSS